MDMDHRIFMKEMHDEVIQRNYENRDPKKPDYDPWNTDSEVTKSSFALKSLESEQFNDNIKELRG